MQPIHTIVLSSEDSSETWCGHEVEDELKASGLLPFSQKQWDIFDVQRYPKTVFQVSRFRKWVLAELGNTRSA